MHLKNDIVIKKLGRMMRFTAEIKFELNNQFDHFLKVSIILFLDQVQGYKTYLP